MARRLAFKGLSQFPIQHRVIRLPDKVARLNSAEVHRVWAEGELDLRTYRAHAVHSSALLRLIRTSGVKSHTVTRLHRTLRPHPDPITSHRHHFPEVYSALLAKARVSQFLIVDAPKPARVQAAGEGHFQFVTGRGLPGRRTGSQPIQGLAIHSRDTGHVLR